jgi:hypothetical protein
MTERRKTVQVRRREKLRRIQRADQAAWIRCRLDRICAAVHQLAGDIDVLTHEMARLDADTRAEPSP